MMAGTSPSLARTADRHIAPVKFVRVCGEAQILAWHSRLTALAQSCGQERDLTFLPHVLSAGRAASKLPCLLVALNPAGELDAAVLLQEYRLFGISSSIFTPTDFAGERDILAPEALRSGIARQAAEHLIQRGALLVLVALQNPDFSRLINLPSAAANIATLIRDSARTLCLANTFDDTLAKLGSHTRRNLRHFRRQAESQLGACFVTEAKLSETQFLKFNRHSLYPARASVARWRFRTARELPGSFFAGVRAADGHWLSLIGGRRDQQVTYIDWQLNSEELPALSLGTVARSFLIEHEIAQGARWLTFEGGTPHSISRSFLPETVTHLLLTRSPLSPSVCRNVLTRVLPKGNLLAKTLSDETLFWHK